MSGLTRGAVVRQGQLLNGEPLAGEARERGLSPEGPGRDKLWLGSVGRAVILSGSKKHHGFPRNLFSSWLSALLQIFMPPQQIFHLASENNSTFLSFCSETSSVLYILSLPTKYADVSLPLRRKVPTACYPRTQRKTYVHLSPKLGWKERQWQATRCLISGLDLPFLWVKEKLCLHSVTIHSRALQSTMSSPPSRINCPQTKLSHGVCLIPSLLVK